MREVIWIDSWVDGRIGGRDVHGSAGERVLEHSKEGEVLPRVCFRGGGEESTGIVGGRGDDTARETDLLSGGFVWVQELREGEGVLLSEGRCSRGRSCLAERAEDWACTSVSEIDI